MHYSLYCVCLCRIGGNSSDEVLWTEIDVIPMLLLAVVTDSE